MISDWDFDYPLLLKTRELVPVEKHYIFNYENFKVKLRQTSLALRYLSYYASFATNQTPYFSVN